MGVLKGKGIWTLFNDISAAVSVAPQVGAQYILCKVSQRGIFSEDQARTALATVRQDPGLKPVAWTYSYLEDVEAEAECIRRALSLGFEAMIIDAEAAINLKFSQAESLAQKVLDMGLDTSRIYLCSDPRLDNKIDEIPTIQLAKMCRGGFIPMIYGEIMPYDRPQAAAKITQAAYAQYESHKAELGYDIPLMPAITSYWDNMGHSRMSYAEFKRWCDEVETRKPSFVSLYRAGVTLDEAWAAFGELKVETAPIEPPTNLLIVQPGGPGFTEGAYPPNEPGTGWSEFVDRSGHLTRYRATSRTQTMWASYKPVLSEAGRYIIDVFIPGTHATTREAQYFISYYENTTRHEKRVPVDQSKFYDTWVTLGFFELKPADEDAGRVNLVDLTSDTTTKEIAFSAIRWRLAPTGGPGYDAPIGTEEERADLKLWPGEWADANPFGNKYSMGYHTGADLNLNRPIWDLDRGKPVYAVADGVVTYANARVGGAWQALVVIKHDPLPDGTPVYSRYGHVSDIAVNEGDPVVRGQQIARVGRSGGIGGNYHLHFDISTTNVLATSPEHWPGWDQSGVYRHYVDPLKFIQAHRP